MRYDTGIIYVTTIDKGNLGQAMDIYAAKVKEELEPELDEHMETLAIGTTIDNTLLDAGTIHSAVKGQYYATIDGQIVYYRLLNTIQEHTPDNTRVSVTVGPMIQWGFDQNLSTYTEANIGEDYIVVLTKNNLDQADNLYAEAEYNLMDAVGTYINSLTLGRTISADAIGASSIRTIVGSGSGKTYYFRPTYTIPAHRSDTRSVTITIGPDINFGETKDFDRTVDLGSEYQYTLTITPENLSQMVTLYTEKVDMMRSALDAHILTLAMGRTFDEADLGVNNAFIANQTISGETIRFKPSISIPSHNKYDISLTVILGPSIFYGNTSNNFATTHSLGSDYKYSIKFEKDTIDHQLAIFVNRLDIIKARFDDYLSSIVLGQLITKDMLETDTIHTCSVYGKTYYFKGGSFSIPGHRTDDKSVDIDIGKDLIYSERSDMVGSQIYTTTGTSPITITRSNMGSASNIYYNAVHSLGTQLANYIESTKLGTTVTPSKLGAETVRSFVTTINQRTIYYKVTYYIPGHAAGDDSVTVTQGSKILYGPASNNLSYSYDPGENYKYELTFTRQNVANCNSVYTANIPIYKQALDDYFSSLILGTKVTANMLAAGTIRTIAVLNRGVYYRPTWTIPEHEETDEEVIITLGPEIKYGLASNNLNYTYNIGEDSTRELSVTVNNIKNPAPDYTTKAEELGEVLKSYLATQLGTLVVQNPYYSDSYTRQLNYDVIPTNVYYQINLVNNTQFESGVSTGTFTLTGVCGKTSNSMTVNTGVTRTISASLDNYEELANTAIEEMKIEMCNIFKKFLYNLKCDDPNVLDGALIPNYTYTLTDPDHTVSKSYYVTIKGTVVSSWEAAGARVKVATRYGTSSSNIRTSYDKLPDSEIGITTTLENDSAEDALQLLADEKLRHYNAIKRYFDSFIGPISSAEYAYEYEAKTGLIYYIKVEYSPIDGFEPFTSPQATIECELSWGTTSIDGPFNHKGDHFTITIKNTLDPADLEDNIHQRIMDEINTEGHLGELENNLEKVVGTITTVTIEKYLELDVTGYSEEVTLGQSTSMAIIMDGGHGKKTVTCDNSNVRISGTTSATFTPRSIGTHTITFTAKDENNVTVTKSISINVKEAEIPLSIKITKYDNKMYLGYNSTITAQITGGKGNKVLTCNNEEVFITNNIGTYIPSKLGTYNLIFTATDEEDNTATASITVKVEQEPRIEEETYTNDAGVTYYIQTSYIPDQNYVPYESEEVELQVEVKYGTEPGHYDQVVSQTTAKVDAINYKDFKIEPKLLVVEETSQQSEQTIEPVQTTVDQIIKDKNTEVQKAIGEIEVVERNDQVQPKTGINYYSNTTFLVDEYNPYVDGTTTIVVKTEWSYVVNNEYVIKRTIDDIRVEVTAENYANYDELVEEAVERQKAELEAYLDTLLGPIDVSTETIEYTSTTTKLKYYLQTTYTVAPGFEPYESVNVDINVVTKWGTEGLNGTFPFNGGTDIATITNENYATYETVARAKGEQQRQTLQAYLNTLIGPVNMTNETIEYTTHSTKILYYIKTTFTNDNNFIPYSSTADTVSIQTSYGTDSNDINNIFTTSTIIISKNNYAYHDSTSDTDVTYTYPLGNRKDKQVEDCKKFLEKLIGNLTYEDVIERFVAPTGIIYYIRTRFTAPADFDPDNETEFNLRIDTSFGTEPGTYDHDWDIKTDVIKIQDYKDDLDNAYDDGTDQRDRLKEYLSTVIGDLIWTEPEDITYTATNTQLQYYIRTIVSTNYIKYSSNTATINITTSWGITNDNYNRTFTNYNEQYKTVIVTPANYTDNSYTKTITNYVGKQREALQAYLDTLIGPITIDESVDDGIVSAKTNVQYYIRTIYSLPNSFSPYTSDTANYMVQTYWTTDPTSYNTLFIYDDEDESTTDDRTIVTEANYLTFKPDAVDLGERQREACKAYLNELIFPEDVYEEYTSPVTNKTYYIRTLNVVKDTGNFYPDRTNNVNVATSYSSIKNTYTIRFENKDQERVSGDSGETYVNNINGEGLRQREALHQYLNTIIGPINIEGYDEDYTALTGLTYHIVITATAPEDFDPFSDTETTINVKCMWQAPSSNQLEYKAIEVNLAMPTYDEDMQTISDTIEQLYREIKDYLDSLLGNLDVEDYEENYTSSVSGVTFNIKVTHDHPDSFEEYAPTDNVPINLHYSWSFNGLDSFTNYECTNEQHDHNSIIINKNNYVRYLAAVEDLRNQGLECLKAYLDTIVGKIESENIDEVYTATTGVKYRITIDKEVDEDNKDSNIGTSVAIVSHWYSVQDQSAEAEFKRTYTVIEPKDYPNATDIVNEQMQSHRTELQAYLDTLLGPLNNEDRPITFTNSNNVTFYINTAIKLSEYTPYEPVTNEFEIDVVVETRWSMNIGEYSILFDDQPPLEYNDINYIITLENFVIGQETIENMVKKQQDELKKYLETEAGPPYSEEFRETYTSPVTGKTYYIITYYNRDRTFFNPEIQQVDEIIHTMWGYFDDKYVNDWQTYTYLINADSYDHYEYDCEQVGKDQRDELKKYLDSLIDYVEVDATVIEKDFYTEPLGLHLFVRESYNVTSSTPTQTLVEFKTEWSLDHDTKYRHVCEDQGIWKSLTIDASNLDKVDEELDRYSNNNIEYIKNKANSFLGPVPNLGAADGLTYVNFVTGVTWTYLKQYTTTNYNYLDGYIGDVEIFGQYGLSCEGIENSIPDRFGSEKELDLNVNNYNEAYNNSYNSTIISFARNQETISKLLGPITIPEDRTESFTIKDGRTVYAKTMYLFNGDYEDFMTRGVYYENEVTITCSTVYGFESDSYDNVFLAENHILSMNNFKTKNTDLLNISIDHIEKLKKMFQMWDIHVDDYDTDFTNMGGVEYIIRTRFIQNDVSYGTNVITYKTSYCLKTKSETDDIIYDASIYTVTLDTFVSVEESETKLALLAAEKVEELKALLDTPNILPISTDNHVFTTSNGLTFVLRVRFSRNPEGINMIDIENFIDGEIYGEKLTRIYHRTVEEAQDDMELLHDQALLDLQNLCENSVPKDVDIIYPEQGDFRYHVKMNYTKKAGDTALSINAIYDGLQYVARTCYIKGSTFVQDLGTACTTAETTLVELKKIIDDTMPKSEYTVYEKGRSEFGISIVYIKQPDSTRIECDVKCDDEYVANEESVIDNIKNLDEITNRLITDIENKKNDIKYYIKEMYPDTVHNVIQKNGFKYSINIEYIKRADSFNVSILAKLDNTEYGTYEAQFNYKNTRDIDIQNMNNITSRIKATLSGLIEVSNSDVNELYNTDEMLFRVETLYIKEADEDHVTITTNLDGLPFRTKTSQILITSLNDDMNTAREIAEGDYDELVRIVGTAPDSDNEEVKTIDNFEYKCGASYYKLSNQQSVLINILLDENVIEQYTDTVGNIDPESDILALKLKAGSKIKDLLDTCKGILDIETEYKNNNMTFTLDIIYIRSYSNRRIYFNTLQDNSKYIDVVGDKNKVYIYSLVDGIQYQSIINEDFYINKLNQYEETGQSQLQVLKSLIDSMITDTEEVYTIHGFNFNINTYYVKYKTTNYVNITVTLDGVKVKEDTVRFNPNSIIDIKNKGEDLANEVKNMLNTCPADFSEVYSPDESHFSFLIGGKYTKEAGDHRVNIYNVLDDEILDDRVVTVDFDISKIATIRTDLTWLKSQLDKCPTNYTEDYHITRENNKVNCHFYITREYSKLAGSKEVRTTILLDNDIFGNVDVRNFDVYYPTEAEDYANLAVGDLKDKLDTIILNDINTVYKKYGFDFNIEVYFTKAAGAKDVTVSYKIEKRKQLDYGDLSEIETIDI